MKPFRKNVAIAVDGGGLRGIIVTRALAILEAAMGMSSYEFVRLAAGTSTGSIISAGIGAKLTAQQLHDLYLELGGTIFKKSWRSSLWPFARYKYSAKPLQAALTRALGDRTMGDFWTQSPQIDVVITTFDLLTNHTRFIKPWKDEYRTWPVVLAVMASSTVPTVFPVMKGRYVDGGVGSYANPCYYAAYELKFCLNWDPAETTLLSLGTGRSPHCLQQGEPQSYYPWQWLDPVLGAFLQSADDQQVHLVNTFFKELDFRRYQVDLDEPIEMDDVSKIPQLIRYGEELGRMIINDVLDPILDQTIPKLETF